MIGLKGKQHIRIFGLVFGCALVLLMSGSAFEQVVTNLTITGPTRLDWYFNENGSIQPVHITFTWHCAANGTYKFQAGVSGVRNSGASEEGPCTAGQKRSSSLDVTIIGGSDGIYPPWVQCVIGCTDTVFGGNVVGVDTTNPTVKIHAPPDGATYQLGETVTVDWLAFDATSGIASAIGPVPPGGLLDTSSAGTFPFPVQATDHAGNNTTVTHTYTVTKPPNQPPTASLSASPTQGKAPLEVTFALSASDPDGSIASWQLAYGDGGADSGAGSPPAAKTHTYGSAGTYIATLTVTDDDGASDSASTTIQVTANQPPTASLTASPSSGKAPLSVSFTLSASDPDGTIVSWSLDYGDESPTTSGSGHPPSTASRTYPTGTYTATLTVTDDDGATAEASTTIQVTANQPILEVSPASLSFSGQEGDTDPTPQNIRISNAGGGTLQWQATTSEPWIRVVPSAGTGPSTVSVSVTIGNLAAGRYSGQITIMAPDATGSPAIVNVSLEVKGRPTTPGPEEPVTKVASWINCQVQPSTIEISPGEEKKVKILGEIEPAHPEVSVTLEIYPPGGPFPPFNQPFSVTTDGSGSFSFGTPNLFSSGEYGQWGIKASWKGDEDHHGAVSTCAFKVTRPSPGQWLFEMEVEVSPECLQGGAPGEKLTFTITIWNNSKEAASLYLQARLASFLTPLTVSPSERGGTIPQPDGSWDVWVNTMIPPGATQIIKIETTTDHFGPDPNGLESLPPLLKADATILSGRGETQSSFKLSRSVYLNYCGRRDFAIDADPETRATTPDRETFYLVTVKRMGGHRAPVTLDVKVPDGLRTASVSLDGGTLKVSGLAEVKPGSYTIAIKGTSEGITRQASVNLIVALAPEGGAIRAKEVDATSPRTTKVTYKTTIVLKQATFIAPGKRKSMENIPPGDFSFTFDQDDLLKASLARTKPEIYLVAKVKREEELGAPLLVGIWARHEKKEVSKKEGITALDYVYVPCAGIGASLVYDVWLTEEYVAITYSITHKGKTIYIGNSGILVTQISVAGDTKPDNAVLTHSYSETPARSDVSVFSLGTDLIAEGSFFKRFIESGWITPGTKGKARVQLGFGLASGVCITPPTTTEVEIE